MSENNSIGETLRNARERMGLGVVQAAERLHVDAEVIDALEAGRFKALGAPVFVRGHLRRYAELLGEPDGPLQQRYASTTEASLSPDLTQVPHRPTPVVPANPRRWPLVMLAIVLVLAAVVWWAMRIRTA
jgi:cytoskeleton protein RodZ